MNFSGNLLHHTVLAYLNVSKQHYISTVVNKHPMGCEAQLAWRCLFTPTCWQVILAHKVGQITSLGMQWLWFVPSWLTSTHTHTHTHKQRDIHTAFWQAYMNSSASLAKNRIISLANLVSKMTNCVSSGTLNPTHSLATRVSFKQPSTEMSHTFWLSSMNRSIHWLYPWIHNIKSLPSFLS